VTSLAGKTTKLQASMQALEEELGLPVSTANQVAFWHAQRLAGSRASVIGYGRIFDLAEVSFRR
jgi:maleate isomerase